MHRFIPILASNLGAKSVEIKVNHRARQFGQSKYGIGRTTRVLLDLMTILFLQRYFTSPMQLFGLTGLWICLFSFVSVVTSILLKIFGNFDMTGTPFLLIGVLSAILGIQFFSLGLIGEVAIRIYYNQSDTQNYQVRELVDNRLLTESRRAA